MRSKRNRRDGNVTDVRTRGIDGVTRPLAADAAMANPATRTSYLCNAIDDAHRTYTHAVRMRGSTFEADGGAQLEMRRATS